jgi:hypothetical protein
MYSPNLPFRIWVIRVGRRLANGCLTPAHSIGGTFITSEKPECKLKARGICYQALSEEGVPAFDDVVGDVGEMESIRQQGVCAEGAAQILLPIQLALTQSPSPALPRYNK